MKFRLLTDQWDKLTRDQQLCLEAADDILTAITPGVQLESKKYTLQSGPLVHVPGLFRFWQNMSANGERRKAFGMAIAAFPTLRAELVFDLLDGRIATTEDAKENLVFEWDEPLGAVEEYLYDWKALAFITDGPKLAWMETMLADWKPVPIPTRRRAQASRTSPRLEVPVESYEAAKQLLIFKVNGRLVRDLTNDDAVFAEGGDAWQLDNVDEAGARHNVEEAFAQYQEEKKNTPAPDVDEEA